MEQDERERGIQSMARQVRIERQQVGIQAGAIGAAGLLFAAKQSAGKLPAY
ncbi:hypothetical protein [Brevibacillus parabrevis]|uniref:hypothetical protein n=1 Tax=Brevibacillus parabrevis TaxID=54914 RepID=UPI00267E8C37|nr:hypothetical protein [Brevibacillus parabrevis]MED1725653.1 hypothetical protein [Brevibacillus parabrevis]